MYHHDLTRSKEHGCLAGLIDIENPDKEQLGKQKLVFGLIWSLKSFAQMVSTDKFAAFKNFSTSQYTMHLYEIPTGLKICLLTRPSSSSSMVTGGKTAQKRSPNQPSSFNLDTMCPPGGSATSE